MLTDNNIYFNEADDLLAKEAVNIGDRYNIRHISFGFEGQVVHSMATHEWFVELLESSSSVECLNDDCSEVKFVDKNNEVIETLTTTSKLGSILASNPTLWIGLQIKTRTE